MYLSYFGLAEAPFSIAPDPHYLYMSQRHQEALAHLLYGVKAGGGFVLLTGEVGAGKTTVCRCLLDQIPASCDVAYIFNPKLTVTELLSSICAEFRIVTPAGTGSIKQYVDCLNAYLLEAHAQGRQSVLIIDEAQNLSSDVLEQMRLLTNLETSQSKLLQIILIGQPELATMLAQPELKQLAQRIIARYHLGSLDKQEVAAYVQHRLEVSGAQRQLFPLALMGKLHQLSGGIPRIINLLCDRSLLGAYTQNKERVDRETLMQAAREIFHNPAAPQRNMTRPLLATLLACMVLLGISSPLSIFTSSLPDSQAQTAPSLPATPPPPLPASLEWPVTMPLSLSEAGAYDALFLAWGQKREEGEPCQQAEEVDLHCHAAQGGLDELRRLNLPAILLMHDKHGQEFHATLSRLDDHAATFSIGAEKRTVALSALAEQWSGEYTLLWRMPSMTRQKIQPGDRGPDVAWLRDRLAEVMGAMTTSAAPQEFDASLTHQTRQFQLVQGLTPDGTAGRQTLMRLSSATDKNAPRLFKAQGVE